VFSLDVHNDFSDFHVSCEMVRGEARTHGGLANQIPSLQQPLFHPKKSPAPNPNGRYPIPGTKYKNDK